MKQSLRLQGACTCLIAWLAAGCASQPTETMVDFDEEALRNTDQDVFFATEFPVASKEEALERAAKAREAGDVDKTLFFYVKALKFDPTDADLLAQIGIVHEYQGNDQLAARAYSLALEADPDFAAVLEARGLLLLRHDEVKRARTDLEQAVAIDPTLWRAHNGLGLIADGAGAHEAALEHYDHALEINRMSGELYNNRGYSKFLSGDEEGAEADLKFAAETYDYNRAKVNLGKLYASRGQYRLAVDMLREVLPQHAAFNKVAETAMQQADYSAAESLLKEAIRISPTYFPEAEQNLVELRQLMSLKQASNSTQVPAIRD